VANILRMTAALRDVGDTFGFADDFEWYISPHRWTSVLPDLGTAAAAGVGGILTLTNSDATVAVDDEVYVYTTNPIFMPAANKPLYCEAYLQFTEANVNAAAVAFGLASAVGADLIVDGESGLRASGTVIALYKISGENVWRFVSRNGASATLSQSDKTAGGAAYQRLGIEILDVMPGSATVVPTVDGQLLHDSTSGLPIKHTLNLSAIAAAGLFMGGKNGSASLESSNWDYAAAFQAR
jgi:hypothetical protein